MPPSSNLIMPKLGLTMTEGTISEWLLAPGDSFRKDDIVLVVETEKIANEIEAPADGILQDILVPAGETVTVGTPIASWDIGNMVSESAGAAINPAPASEPAPAPAPKLTSAPEPAVSSGLGQGPSKRVIATPLAKRIARQNEVDLHGVTGSGPKGRIKAADVRAAIGEKAVPAAMDMDSGPPAPSAVSGRAPTSYEAVAARRLTEAKRDIPHFYLATEVDAGPLLDLRRQLNAENEALRISINHLIIAAVARALKENTRANTVWQDGQIVELRAADIGVAVSTEKGLYAPVLRDLADVGIATIAKRAQGMIEKARSGTLAAEDLSGGATTISNAGMFDVTYMSSIINPGQSSILGVGSIRQIFRPDSEGKPVLKQEMGLVLSADHRILDGVGALAFLNSIKAHLEKPLGLLVN